MADLTWQDFEDIGIELSGAHPGVDPLTVRFTELHRLVRELPGFTDDPTRSNEKILERIQMAWYEQWQERKQ